MTPNKFEHLGKQSTEPLDLPEIFDWDKGSIEITLHCTEFSSHCPVTTMPDYGEITLQYIPDKRAIETKSFKLYLMKYREIHAFNEHIVAMMMDELKDHVQPIWMRIEGRFNIRGGIKVSAVKYHNILQQII